MKITMKTKSELQKYQDIFFEKISKLHRNLTKHNNKITRRVIYNAIVAYLVLL